MKPTKVRDPGPLERGFVVGLLRAAGAGVHPDELAAAHRAGFDEGHRTILAGTESLRERLVRLERLVDRLGEVSGVRLSTWVDDGDRAGEIGRALRAVLTADGTEQRARARIEQARDQLVDAAAALDWAME